MVQPAILWILSCIGFYYVDSMEQCVDRYGTRLDCHHGCCGERADSYCCSFHLWVIILFGLAGAAVLIPVALIVYCLIRDKFCSTKPLLQENVLRRRHPVQLSAVNNVHSTTVTTVGPSSLYGGANPAYLYAHSSPN